MPRLVRREPIKASVSQVRNLFYRLYTMSAANGNYRTVMPINARIIEAGMFGREGGREGGRKGGRKEGGREGGREGRERQGCS